MNTVIQRLAVVSLVAGVGALCAERQLFCQESASQTPSTLVALPSHAETSWNGAKNRWQLTAVDLKSQVDTVSPDIRAKRNAYWMQPVMHEAIQRFNSNDTNSSRSGITVTHDETPGLVDDSVSELGNIEDGALIWVVATFENFHVYAIDSAQTLLYTEMNMRIANVIKVPRYLHLSSGDLLDVMRLGGRAKSASGKLNTSVHLSPMKYSLVPKHTYILRLFYNPRYDTYTLSKDWDVTSGSVQPDGELEAVRAKRGKSKLAGLSVDEAVSYLSSVLPRETDK